MQEIFRNEIIEAEKARTDLLKWKIIIVSGLGALGLGFQPNDNIQSLISPHLVLCLIPLICLYIDVLCKNLQLRILAISIFFQHRNEDSIMSQYEKYCHDLRETAQNNTFFFEDFAISISTLFFSFLILISPLILSLKPDEIILFICSGAIGITLPILMEKTFKSKRKILHIKSEIYSSGNRNLSS